MASVKVEISNQSFILTAKLTLRQYRLGGYTEGISDILPDTVAFLICILFGVQACYFCF